MGGRIPQSERGQPLQQPPLRRRVEPRLQARRLRAPARQQDQSGGLRGFSARAPAQPEHPAPERSQEERRPRGRRGAGEARGRAGGTPQRGDRALGRWDEEVGSRWRWGAQQDQRAGLTSTCGAAQLKQLRGFSSCWSVTCYTCVSPRHHDDIKMTSY